MKFSEQNKFRKKKKKKKKKLTGFGHGGVAEESERAGDWESAM